MKASFDRHQERLTPREREAIWQRVKEDAAARPARSRAWRNRAWGGGWGGALRDARWQPAVVLGAVVAVAVVAVALWASRGLWGRHEIASVAPEPSALPPGIEVILTNREPREPTVATVDTAGRRDVEVAAAPPAAEELRALGYAAPGAEPGRPAGGVAVASSADAARPPAGSEVVASAQVAAGGIRGVVTCARTGEPVSFASVLLLGTERRALTEDDGSFAIQDVGSGTFALEVAMLGYEPDTLEVEVGPSEASEVRVALREAGAMAVAVTRGAPGSQYVFPYRSINPPQETKSAPLGLEGGIGAGTAKTEGDQDATRWGAIRSLEAGRTEPPPLSGIPAPVPDIPRVPVYGGTTLPNDQVYDSMFFEHYGVNPFIPTDEDALSTFAVDVDAASYTVARRYIVEGHLPPKEAARVEEFVNFFRQGYPGFERPDFRIFLDGAPSPFGKGYHLLRVGIKGREVPARDRKPANLVFVIDVSGSMAREDRLELVKRALGILVGELRPTDRVGIVVYGSTASVVLEPASVGEREEILAAIEGLYPNGSTNAEEGLLLGYEMARRAFRAGGINRIVLCSDGVANVGRTGAESILERVRREADRGIHLSAIGFGMGNYNDVLMEQLADKGDGNYYYVDDLKEARRVLEENLTGTLQTIARDAKVQVEFDPEVVTRYRLLGFENRDVPDQDFRNDAVDAGEIGAGHEVTALYEVKIAAGKERGRIATVRFRYALPDGEGSGAPEVREMAEAVRVEDLARDFGDAAPRLRLAAAVAEFAEVLRKSYWARGSTIAAILPIVRRVAEDLPGDREVVEFAQLVARAADLTDRMTAAERDAGWPEADPRWQE